MTSGNVIQSSPAMDSPALTGLVAATFTPFHSDGRVQMERIPEMVDVLAGRGLRGIYVNGTTGEGPSLTTGERKSLAEAYIRAADGRIPVIVQVGHNSLNEARDLASHAASAGATAISATPPGYFRPDTVEILADVLLQITSAAPDTPFYYYHIPAFGGVSLDMSRLLAVANERIPNMRGIKFSSPQLHELDACRRTCGEAFDILFGVDEMLLGAAAMGVRGAVGSTYNFAPRIYLGIIDALERGDLDEARRLQSTSVDLIRALIDTCGRAGLKATMTLSGVDCGAHRLPLKDASPEQIAALDQRLYTENLRQWLG
jgi:N-acetylneuraminate lyase